jgi:hypothetical protein
VHASFLRAQGAEEKTGEALVATEQPPQPTALIHLIGSGRQLVLARLLELTHADANITAKSLELLGRLGEYAAGEQVASRLNELLDGSVAAETRERAVEALLSIYRREAAGPGRERVIARLLELTHSNANITAFALEVLGRLGEYAAGEQVASGLNELLDGSVPAETRDQAAEALLSIYRRDAAGPGRERVIARLLELTHGDANNTAFALEQLGRLGEFAAEEQVASRLGELLDSAAPAETRSKAAAALVAIYGHHLPYAVSDYLERVLIEHREWPAEVAGRRSDRDAKFDALLDRLLHLLAAEPGMPTSKLDEAVRSLSRRKKTGPPMPHFRSNWLEISGGPPDLIASLKLTARSGDKALVDKIVPMILSGSPAVRWSGLKIAENFGIDAARIDIKPLMDRISNLLADTDELVRQQAAKTLESLRRVAEQNHRLGEVWQQIEEVARDLQTRRAWGTRIAEIVSSAMPPDKTQPAEAEQATTKASISLPTDGQPATHDERYLDASSILAALKSPEPPRIAIESLRMVPGIAGHPELLPALASVASRIVPALRTGEFEAQPLADWVTIAPTMAAIVAENPVAPEVAATIETLLPKLSEPDVRNDAISVLRNIAPPPDSLPPHIVRRIVPLILSQDPAMRTAGLDALTCLASPHLVWWRGAFRSPHKHAGASNVASEEVLKCLPGLLLDASPEVRAAAIVLVTALGEEARSGEVIAALRSLIDDPRIILEDRTQDMRWFDSTRGLALRALGALGPPAFEAAAFSILNMVMDAAPETQLAAAEAAFAMGPEARGRVLEMLVAMMREGKTKPTELCETDEQNLG